MLLAWFVGTALGALIGWLQRHRLSQLAVILSTLLQITPVYLVALGLIIYVGYTMRVLPAGGPYARHLQPEWSWEFIGSLLTHAILPMLSNMIVISAGFTLGMRALMISVLGEDYLTFARAKGLNAFHDPQRLRFPQRVDTPGNRSCHHRRDYAERDLHHRDTFPIPWPGHLVRSSDGSARFQYHAGCRFVFHLRCLDADIDCRSGTANVGSAYQEDGMRNPRIITGIIMLAIILVVALAGPSVVDQLLFPRRTAGDARQLPALSTGFRRASPGHRRRWT